MDWNLFWTAVGAIGGSIGAIATFSAVVVALWQTKYNNRKKLKVTVTEKNSVVSMKDNQIFHYVGLSVINIGNRDVVIKSWGFELNGDSRLVIISELSPLGEIISAKLPHRLSIEEGIDLFYEKKHFLKTLEDYINKGELDGDKPVRFYVQDSTNKRHYAETKKSAKALLDETNGSRTRKHYKV